MANAAASQPAFEAGPVPWAPGRLRVLVAAALAVALHSALLLTARPTLLGSAPQPSAPAMLVRMLLAAEAVPTPTRRSADTMPSTEAVPVSPPPPAGEVAHPGVRAADGSGAPRRGEATAAVSKAVPSTVPTAPTPTVAPALPPAPTYLAAGRLDPGPKPLDDVEPVYPDEANLQEGSVVLRLLINESGTVDNVAVVRAYPKGLFERSALDAFAPARFSPGMRFGVAVKSQITIEVMFSPINRGARVSGRSY